MGQNAIALGGAADPFDAVSVGTGTDTRVLIPSLAPDRRVGVLVQARADAPRRGRRRPLGCYEIDSCLRPSHGRCSPISL